MSNQDSPVKKDPTKWRLALQCAVETGVSEKIAYVVLTTDVAITTDARERAYRWFVEKRVLVRKERTRTPRKESPVRPLERAVEEYTKEFEKLFGTPSTRDRRAEFLNKHMRARETEKGLLAQERAKELRAERAKMQKDGAS